MTALPPTYIVHLATSRLAIRSRLRRCAGCRRRFTFKAVEQVGLERLEYCDFNCLPHKETHA